VELFGRRPVGAAGDPRLQDVRIGVDGAVHRPNVLNPGQDEGSILFPQGWAQCAVNGLEIAPEALLLDFFADPLPMHDHASSRPAARCGMGPEFPLRVVVSKGVLDARGQARHVHHMNGGACSNEQPSLVLAQREDEEATIAGEQGQQRGHVESVRDHDQLLEIEREQIATEPFRPQEQSKPPALVPPKCLVIDELSGWVENLARNPVWDPGTDQTPLRSADEVLQADRVLLRFGAAPVGGHVQRHAGGPRLLSQQPQIISR
jgi:hypothetical protein